MADTGKSSGQIIYLDPSYPAFYEDRLFDLSDRGLNRDDQLLPGVRLRDEVRRRGGYVTTADRLSSHEGPALGAEYYSMGSLPDYELLRAKNVALKAYMLVEPPVVAPKLYNNIAQLSHRFERVFLHNVHGDGYSLQGVRTAALRKLFYPIPYRGVLDKYWNRTDRAAARIVVINGSHRPISRAGELYSARIEAIAELESFGGADLFGRGWDRLIARCSLWWPALRHRRAILRAYRGACESKFETLSAYTFCLCFENMCMDGYVTEKIFDCFYAGTIPIYLGPKDISNYVSSDAFVDCRAFGSMRDVFEHVRAMTPAQIAAKREAARAFMEGEGVLPYYQSLENMVLGGEA